MEHFDSNHHNTLSQNCDSIYPVQHSTHSSCSKQQWCTTTSPHIQVSLENFFWATRKDLLVITLSSQRRIISQNPAAICPPSWAFWRYRVAKYRARTQDFDPGDWPGANFFLLATLLCHLMLNIECIEGRGKTPESWTNSASSCLPIYHHLFIVYFMVLLTQCLIIAGSFLLLQIHPPFHCGTLCFETSRLLMIWENTRIHLARTPQKARKWSQKCQIAESIM